MKFKSLLFVASFLVTLTIFFQSVQAQTKKESSLIAKLVKEANQPDSHSVGDVYLRISIGITAYTTELKSGKIVSQDRSPTPSGGFSGAYVEVGLHLLDKGKQETSQGAGQILKLTGTTWKRVAIAEGDYQCDNVKLIPKATLKALKVECY